jgi:hypothetical protein
MPGEAGRHKPATVEHRRSRQVAADTGCTEGNVWQATKHSLSGERARYSCQATELLHFTAPLKWWDARQYVEDCRSVNASLGQILRGVSYLADYYGTLANRGRLGRPARGLYDRFMRSGVAFRSPGAQG